MLEKRGALNQVRLVKYLKAPRRGFEYHPLLGALNQNI